MFIIPGIFLFVYLGDLADDIRQLSSGDSPLDGTVTIIIAAISGTSTTMLTVRITFGTGVVIVLVVVLTSRYARRAINKRLMMDEDDNMPSQERLESAADQSDDASEASPV